MKKLTLAIFASLTAVTTSAAPVGETFNGLGIGLDLTTVKYKTADLKGKQSTGANLVVDHTIEYGNNLIGLVEGKLKLGSSTIFNNVKQKSQFGVSYLQGYRVMSDILPYAKLNYSISKVSDVGSFKGFGYGLGVKYAISNDIELSSEYLRSNIKYHGTKLKGNAFSAMIGYRF